MSSKNTQNLVLADFRLMNRQNVSSQVQNQQDNNVLRYIKQITIYLRLSNKRAHKILVYQHVQIKDIIDKVQQYFQIPTNQQLLFYQSKPLNLNESSKYIDLSDGNIIHISSRNDLSKYNQTMEVNCECYYENSKILSAQIFVNSNKKIIEALGCLQKMNKNLEIRRQWIQIYAHGHKLNIQNSFFEEQISKKSHLIIMISQLRSTIQANLQQTQFQNQQNYAPQITVNTQKYNDYQHEEPSKDVLQIKSINSFEDQHQAPLFLNFKKQKKTSHLYKSTRSPIGKEAPKWESDSSSQFNKKQRIKAFFIKKDSNQTNCNDHANQFDEIMKLSNSSENGDSLSRLNIFQKMQLKSDIRKLFQSQRFHKTTEVKKLQPPCIMTDQFMDQIEQLQFHDNEIHNKPTYKTDHKNSSQQLKQLKMFNLAKPMHLSNTLRHSLGHPGRKDWPTLMIPTRDIDLDIEQDQQNEQEDQIFDDFQ